MRTYKIVGIMSLLFTLILFSAFKIKDDKENTPQWQNVHVLPKNLSHEDMDAIMEAYNTSLGVTCGYCHVKGDKASDDKEEKRIARKMITMTNEINEKYFGKNTGTIGCMTCHNGKTNPSAP